MSKMNQDVKKRWIKALRSGKYRRGEGRLCTTHKGRSRFCCLGVLAHEELDGEWQESDEVYEGTKVWDLFYKGERDDASLPEIVLIETGLSIDHSSTLVHMNDEGESFRRIADWIEENL